MAFYNYLGYGVTDENGIAKLDHDADGEEIEHSYTGTGAGEIDVIASLDNASTISDSSIQSDTYKLLDAMFRDVGILNDPNNNDTYYQYRCSITRQSDGTLLTPTTSNNGLLMIDETGDNKPFNTELCFETDIVSSDNSSNGFMMVGTNNLSFNIPTTTGYHIKIEIKNTGITVTIDDGTPTSYSAITGNYDIRMRVSPSSSIKFKNTILYPI